MNSSLMKLVFAALLIGSFAAAPNRALSGPKHLVIVVASGSPITNISHSDLRRAFTMDPIALGGRKVFPFNYGPGARERVVFDASVLGMSPDEVGRFWVDRKVRGELSAPRSLPSTAHMLKVVAKFPGAIGYVPEDELTNEVQPVTIDGIPHTSPAYPITMN